MVSDWADETHDLSDYLGDAHDFVELRRAVEAEPDIFKNEEERQSLLALTERRRFGLEAAARPLGERLYVEKPRRFVNRIEAYWQVWQQYEAT